MPDKEKGKFLMQVLLHIEQHNIISTLDKTVLDLDRCVIIFPFWTL